MRDAGDADRGVTPPAEAAILCVTELNDGGVAEGTRLRPRLCNRRVWGGGRRWKMCSRWENELNGCGPMHVTDTCTGAPLHNTSGGHTMPERGGHGWGGGRGGPGGGRGSSSRGGGVEPGGCRSRTLSARRPLSPACRGDTGRRDGGEGGGGNCRKVGWSQDGVTPTSQVGIEEFNPVKPRGGGLGIGDYGLGIGPNNCGG